MNPIILHPNVSIQELPLELFLSDLKGTPPQQSLWRPKVASLYSRLQEQYQPWAQIIFPSRAQLPAMLPDCAILAVTLKEQCETKLTTNTVTDSYLHNLILTRLLFFISEQCEQQLHAQAHSMLLTVKRRLEAPNDFDPTLLAQLLSLLRQPVPITLSDSFALQPAHSMLLVYELAPSYSNSNSQTQPCAQCPDKDCSFRSHQLTVLPQNQTLLVRSTKSIADALTRAGILLSLDCGGQGSCGKCRIIVKSGNLPITKADQRTFSILQLSSGLRLACQAYLTEDITISLPPQKDLQIHAVTSFHMERSHSSLPQSEREYGIAIDLGTTTLAATLIRLNDLHVLQTASAINRQRLYGADVLSRIQAATQSSAKARAMQRLIQMDLLALVQKLLTHSDVKSHPIERIVLAGNTTMIHLLLGYDCSGLGTYPFKAHSLSSVQTSFSEVFRSSYLTCPVLILPAISTFVGGDIVSGLFACQCAKSDSPNLFIDLGTNGEMAVGGKKGFFVSSTAAGPAFEGGSIQCGTGSVPGAITRVLMQSNHVQVETIDNQPPCGICGTGVLETTAMLLQEHLMDKTGLLSEPFCQSGFVLAKTSYGESIIFTQKDVRELQLAKSAIRSGIELLLSKANCSYKDVHTVYLAGGFGTYLDVNKAISIGMIPKPFSSKTIAVGNSSLYGAMLCAQNPAALEEMNQITKMAQEIHLAKLPEFQENFIHYLNFEP